MNKVISLIVGKDYQNSKLDDIIPGMKYLIFKYDMAVFHIITSLRI